MKERSLLSANPIHAREPQESKRNSNPEGVQVMFYRDRRSLKPYFVPLVAPLVPLAAFIFSTRALVVVMTRSSSQMESTLCFAIVAFAHLEKLGNFSRPALTDVGSRPAPERAKMRSKNGAMLT